MQTIRISRLLPAVVTVGILALPAARVTAAVVDPALAAAIAGMKPGQEVPVILVLSDRVSPSAFAPRGEGTKASGRELVRALKAKAAATQPAVLSQSEAIGGRKQTSLWAINAIALTVRKELVTALSHFPGVESVRLDAVLTAPTTPTAPATATTATVEWNVQMLQAQALWSAGIDGTGVVVATLDTGVDPNHPDIGPRYRGGTNSWYDPNGQHATPSDADGHGTHTMSLLVGGSAGGTAIGVAPGAKWIAAKIFNDQGQATTSGIHQAFQWLLDPDGDPATDDAPNVVSNSWGFPSLAGSCYTEFASDISVLRAAGIEVVFSAGNDGGASGTSESPANNPGAFSAGAVDSSQVIAPFSSRGPSACGGGTFPNVVAGGVSVKTADLTLGGIVPNSYAIVTGTSFAAPQVAGALALLAAAHPTATLSTLEGALQSTAVDLGLTGADNDYGAGLPDVMSANTAIGNLPPPPSAQPDSYAAAAGTTLSAAAPGVLANDSSPSGAPLSASLVTRPSAGTLAFAADGSFTYLTPTTAGTYTFTYLATDGTQWSPPTAVTITVNGAPLPPVAHADAYSLSAGTPLSVAAPGVLANDTSPSGKSLSAVLLSGPSKAVAGSFVLNANGSFTYATSILTASTDSFTYAATDGTLQSPAATVTITIAAHPAPVAANDTYSVARNSSAAAFAVLVNDTATNATLVPSSVAVVKKPNHSGTATVNANGTISYKPARTFTGTETFTYKVKDSLGATSNTATVTVNVK
jgi:bacillopeptidase F